MREFLYPVMAKICTDVRATLEAFDDEDDQVRPLVCQPPKIASGMLNKGLKGRVVSANQKREVSQNHRPSLGKPFLVTQPMHRKLQRHPA